MPPSVDISSLSTDAKNLLLLAKAIEKKEVSLDLANTKLGPIFHARWLTKAARILRVYVSTSKPTKNVQILTEYVMKVYIPMYFNVKYYNSILYGSFLLFKFIHWINFLPQDLISVVHQVMNDNSYYAHSESILLGMIFDERKPIREMAFEKIMFIRRNKDQTKLRAYEKPKINFACTDYINMIDLNNNNILFEPPFTKKMPFEHLNDYKDSDEVVLDINIPCHIQGTERNVKEVTRASKHVTEKHKAGFLATSTESREKMPKFESKQDFK